MTSEVETFLNDRQLELAADSTAQDYVDAAADDFRFLHLREAVSGWPDVQTLYRGQRNASWGVQSSLARLLAVGDTQGRLTERHLCDAEAAVLAQARARHEGSASADGSWLGRNLSGGQLLAVLQHQEVPTRFIDVTSDPLTALYFASDDQDLEDGRVFLLVLNRSTTRLNLADKHLSWGAADGLPWPRTMNERNSSGEWTNKVFHIEPGFLDPRMSAQRGSFIVGGLARAYSDSPIGAPAGQIHSITSLSLGFRSSRHRQHKIAASTHAFAWSLRIPARLKPQIRAVLADNHGISSKSLFPDYASFRELGRYVAQHRSS